MARGKVTQWNGQTGRIRDDADGASVFFGDRALRGLTAGDVQVGIDVEFDRFENDRGPAARNVRRAGAPAGQPPLPGPATQPVQRERLRGAASDIPCPPNGPVLPGSLQKVVDQLPEKQRHPGLQLDKYSFAGEQTLQKTALGIVAGIAGDAALFQDLGDRRRLSLQNQRTQQLWQRTTAGPLTLHLARASALENAGLCLHPLYGFAYLPGSGIKGMARAYAETVWKLTRPADENPEQLIEAVFGNEPGEPKQERQRAGAIVFQDAWPTTWPKLAVDICNNHHDGYYQETEPPPPGDWFGPVPVYFLAIQPGQTFTFALNKRRADAPSRLLELAREWLDGALTLLGCGAKTAAGYGAFRAAEPAPVLPSSRRSFRVTLGLTSPAFLAGASQQEAADCILRPATLRGLLRWWWRTIHVGFAQTRDLRAMEAALWGDTNAGGSIRLTVTPDHENPPPEPCPFLSLTRNRDNQEVLRFDRSFAQEQGIELPRGNLTPGLLYHSYGMDTMDAGDLASRRRRWFAPVGSLWKVQLEVRPTRKEGRTLDAAVLLDEVKLALWWLCKLGGVGAKARKGFGSLQMPPELAAFDGERWRSRGRAYRDAFGLPPGDFRPDWAGSANLHQMTALSRQVLGQEHPWLEVQTPWDKAWRALDELGQAAQAFAQAPADTRHGKHCPEKLGLGLPRKIHKGRQTQELQGEHGDRHASPVHYHLDWSNKGYNIRVSAFPTGELRAPRTTAEEGLQRQQDILGELLIHLQHHLEHRASLP